MRHNPLGASQLHLLSAQEHPLIQTIADALADQGYDTMTPVQDAVIAPELEGADANRHFRPNRLG